MTAVASFAQVNLPAVPSGQMLELVSVEKRADGTALSISILAPAISKVTGSVNYEQAEIDMEYLCTEFALSRSMELKTPEVLIRLMEKKLEWGVSDPDVIQYFGLYDVSNGKCDWL